jgi:hypothetical protein
MIAALGSGEDSSWHDFLSSLLKTITYVIDLMMLDTVKLTDLNVVDNHSHYHLKYHPH